MAAVVGEGAIEPENRPVFTPEAATKPSFLPVEPYPLPPSCRLRRRRRFSFFIASSTARLASRHPQLPSPRVVHAGYSVPVTEIGRGRGSVSGAAGAASRLHGDQLPSNLELC
ncbi:hypothetical protein PIB30_030191 [Stylosanthes scabra]|uniref:Uncharacterized protein n=1 Tax=Stylosanthes scabra TaxID=79078 RepID=A0ABU6TB86_9FABA|nr:hypothetical protein [Stylosanthes scabra]